MIPFLFVKSQPLVMKGWDFRIHLVSSIDLERRPGQNLPVMDQLLAAATTNVRDMLKLAIEAGEDTRILVVYDERNALTNLVTAAYRAAVPAAVFLNFDEQSPETVIAAIRARQAGDTVVLVQSSNFRLDAFRLRIEIFARGIRTIEHVHLQRNTPDQYATYIESLAYDPNYYRPLGRALAAKLATAKTATVRSLGGNVLHYSGPMEPAKLNLGDYTGMKNVGGTFPIGEVFTEPTDLTKINGQVTLYAFGGSDFYVAHPEPFTCIVTDGILTAPNAPEEFKKVLISIAEDEPVQVREFGLGLNRAMGPTRFVNDVTAYERCVTLHLSLGTKHAVYKKEGIIAKKTRHHVDVFVAIESIHLDDQLLFDGQQYFV